MSEIRALPEAFVHAAAPVLLDGTRATRWVGKAAPPLKFVIADLVPDEACTLLAGDGGSGKRILLQTMATCVAIGRVFTGHTVDRPSHLHHGRRHRSSDPRAARAHQPKPGHRNGRSRGFAPSLHGGQGFHALRRRRADRHVGQLAVAASTYGVRFLAIDSASLVFDDVEIDRRAVSAFLRRLNQLGRAAHCALVLIAYTSRSSDGTSARMASGSTAWVNAARAGLLLKSDDEGGAELSLLKANYSKAGLKIPLCWNDDGVLVAEEQASGMVASLEQRRDDTAVLAEISAAWTDPAAAPLGRAPQLRERFLSNFMARKHGWKPKRTEAALARLFDAGKVSNGETRKNGKRLSGLCPISHEE
jgi:hypothetical protein